MKPSAPGKTETVTDITISPRGFPLWAQALATAFSMAIVLIAIAGPLVPLVTRRLVVDAHAPRAALPLLIAVLSACVAAGILHFARLKALTGFERSWPSISYKTATSTGVLMTLVLGLVHPLLAAAPVFSCALSIGSGWVRKRIRQAPLGGDPDLIAAVLSGVEDPSVLGARQRRADHAMIGTLALALFFGLMSAVVCVDFLVARGVLAPDMRLGAFVAIAWPVAVLAVAPALILARHSPLSAPVVSMTVPSQTDNSRGTIIRDLSVTSADDQAYLTRINIDIDPGVCVGLAGPSASGKSLLLQAIANPHTLPDGRVTGAVSIDGQLAWERDGQAHRPRLVHVGPRPKTLDSTGVENIACGLRTRGEELSRIALEDLFVFGKAADRILDAPNARTLSDREQQLSALARAFLLGPSLYLLDTPENTLTARDVGRVASKIRSEKAAGRSAFMVTNDRSLLECCDTILMMNDGRITDRGPRETVLRRQQSGRARLMLERSADEEDRLHNWLRSQFNRPGDERNRRTICLAASEALSLPHQSDRLGGAAALIWEFQHQKGQAILEMIDQSDPISPSELQKGKELARKTQAYSADTPIANLLRRAKDVEQLTDDLEPPYTRKLRLIVPTYDPRDQIQRQEGAPADVGA